MLKKLKGEQKPFREKSCTWIASNRLVVSYFFSNNEGLDSKIYHETWLQVYREESDQLCSHQRWSYQQDETSCHTDHRAELSWHKNFEFSISQEKWSPKLIWMESTRLFGVSNQISNQLQYQKVKTINNLHREVMKAVMNIVLLLFCFLRSFINRIDFGNTYNTQLFLIINLCMIYILHGDILCRSSCAK